MPTDLTDTIDAIEAEAQARKVPAPDDCARLRDNFVEAYRCAMIRMLSVVVLPHHTVDNALNNIDHYVTSIGCADLRLSRLDRPAICIAAGPSLSRSLPVLRQWCTLLRDRVTIITVQTPIKHLLRNGVRPHFVTALDYSPLSAKFYEGLEGDLSDTDLVAMPQSHPSICDSWPGRIRMTNDAMLADIVGHEYEMGWTGSGSTVAHMSYLLARFMGCDPVILVGQDLGFMDMQYYHAGAAVHDARSGEFGPFYTPEMAEHERVMSHGPALVECKDKMGRPMYTDVVFDSYWREFCRYCSDDKARGLRTINATDGGRPIDGCEVMSLGAAIQREVLLRKAA